MDQAQRDLFVFDDGALMAASNVYSVPLTLYSSESSK
jgi:hypothetical protein